jgi:hypothetical protein
MIATFLYVLGMDDSHFGYKQNAIKFVQVVPS